MSTVISIFIDGEKFTVPDGISVATALAFSGDSHTRLSVSGQPRAPFCGMGVCHECRVSVNGRRVLACQTLCQVDMQIERGAHANVAV